MNTKFNRLGMWAAAFGALALAGCDSIKDVRSEPATELPADKVVLKGVIQGLGGGRAITLRYASSAAPTSLVGPDPAYPTAQLEEIPFSFGSLDAGTAYNIEITGQPFGKHCELVSGQSGTLTKGVETNAVIQCAADIPRFDLTVQIPPTPAVFSGLNKARVVLVTGEQMQERTITPGQTSVVFEDALFNPTTTIPNPNPTPGGPATVVVPLGTPLNYSVSASYVDTAGNESRCLVTNATGSNPPTDVTNVVVGLSATTTVPACQFTMSGSVAYSAPVGGTGETGAIPGGLLLEVRDLQTNVKASYEVTNYGGFTISDANGPTLFSSNINAIYDVAVKRHPTGRTCVVGDGGAVSFYRTGAVNPINVTDTAALASLPGTTTPGTRAWGSRLNVFCRLLPAAGNRLSGTYRLTNSTWRPAPTTAVPNPVSVTVPYRLYDWTTQNLGSSNMMAFFADGTFLYGTHAYISGVLPGAAPDGGNAAPYSTQVEHGFYAYDPVAGTLRFTLITDTNPTATFPTAYAAIDNVVWNAARTGTPGLSAAPAPTVTGTPVAGAGIGMWTAMMTNVQKTTVTFGEGRAPNQTLSKITGTFGGATSAVARLDWELTEPQSITGEMTGTWTASDNRRFWVWDYLTYYGTQVGVANGSPTMNDACFTVAQAQASYGIYTRRGSSTGCYAYNRPARGAAYLFGVAEAADFHLTDMTLSTNTFVGVAPLATATGGNVAGSRLAPQFGTTALAVLPGFAGRIPGGQSAADGRSPSPVVYKIAPAASFASSVATTVFDDIGQPAARYFDDVATPGKFDWCPTEILGIRATRNGEPQNFPVYFCRTRAAP
jgi:hypothetical protein